MGLHDLVGSISIQYTKMSHYTTKSTKFYGFQKLAKYGAYLAT